MEQLKSKLTSYISALNKIVSMVHKMVLEKVAAHENRAMHQKLYTVVMTGVSQNDCKALPSALFRFPKRGLSSFSKTMALAVWLWRRCLHVCSSRVICRFQNGREV